MYGYHAGEGIEDASMQYCWQKIGKTGPPFTTQYLIAGSAAGVATTVFGCPSERIMVLAHIRKQGMIHVAQEIGFKGMYQGWRVTLNRDIVFNAFFFTARDMLVDLKIKWSSSHKCKFEWFSAGLPAGECMHTCGHICIHTQTIYHHNTHTFTTICYT